MKLEKFLSHFYSLLSVGSIGCIIVGIIIISKGAHIFQGLFPIGIGILFLSLSELTRRGKL